MGDADVIQFNNIHHAIDRNPNECTFAPIPSVIRHSIPFALAKHKLYICAKTAHNGFRFNFNLLLRQINYPDSDKRLKTTIFVLIAVPSAKSPCTLTNSMIDKYPSRFIRFDFRHCSRCSPDDFAQLFGNDNHFPNEMFGALKSVRLLSKTYVFASTKRCTHR